MGSYNNIVEKWIHTYSVKYLFLFKFTIHSYRGYCLIVFLLAVRVKSCSRLSAKFPLSDKVCDQPLRAAFRLRLFNGHVEIQPCVVEELKGPHGVTGA